MKRLLVSVSFIGLIGFSASASAQEAIVAGQGQPSPNPTPAATASVSDAAADIVVTAQRRAETLKDVPVSVLVTRGDDLVKSNISSITDLSSRLPSVRIVVSSASNFLNIRGVGSSSNAGFEQSVGTFVDGLYRGRSRAIGAALFDLERLEVLRGPQSIAFGNNAIAGALNIVTRKPGQTFAVNGTATYSPRNDGYALELGADLPISDSLSMRVAGKLYGQNGWAHNYVTDKNLPRERDGVGRVSLAWRPTDSWRTDLRVETGHLRDHGSPTEKGINCPAPAIYYPTSGGRPPATGACGIALAYAAARGTSLDDALNYNIGAFLETRVFYDYTEVGLTNAIDLGTSTLTTISGYFTHDANVLSDGAAFPGGGLVAGTASAQPVNSYDRVSQYSQELRFQTDVTRPLSGVFGVYYARENLRNRTFGGQFSRPVGQLAGPPYTAATKISSSIGGRQNTDTWSAFGSVTITPLKDFGIDLGLRYSSVEKNIARFFTYGVVTGAFPSVDDFAALPTAAAARLATALGTELGDFSPNRRVDRKLQPSVKLRYAVTPDISAYASYTKGFKAGGFATSARRFIFDPEGVDAYEAGIKASLLNRRLFGALTFYRSDYSNLQESGQVFINGAAITVVENAASARSQGVEFEGSLRISPIFTIGTEISYNDSRYRSYPNGQCTILANLKPNCVQDLAGKRRGYAPQWSGAVHATASIPVRDDYTLQIEPSMFFTSGYFQTATADPLFRQDGYTKVDLRIGFGPTDRRWEVAVIGRNLTNKITTSNQYLSTSPGSVNATLDPPRIISFQLSTKL